MKRLSTIIMALVLALGLTQCKKNEPTADNQGEIYNITLNVGGASSSANKGEKVDVNPITGSVNFKTGDKIHVASAGKYVGMLTYDGTVFTGAIGNATEGLPLQFYFLGNVDPAETLSIGTSESCSVVISDQTTHLPLISAAPSVENFYGNVTDYTAELKNKCALVKFNVTTSSTAPTCITGFNNKVTIDFAENTITNSQEGDGAITLPAGNGEKWAILLPQNSMTGGEAYASGDDYAGTFGAVPAMYVNGYFPAGIPVEVNIRLIPDGAIAGKFSVGANQKVYFSQGNLQYTKSTSTWSFMEHQYDIVETAGMNIGDDYANQDVIGLFGHGTSGYNHGAICYQPWATTQGVDNYFAYGNENANLYDGDGTADWGYNAISNGGNQPNSGWRTPTNDEWVYLFSGRTDAASKYGYSVVNGMKGMVLLPDNWTLPDGLSFAAGDTPWSNEYTTVQWAQMEDNGAVFLPLACTRKGNTINNSSEMMMEDEMYHSQYWLSSKFNKYNAYVFYFGTMSNPMGGLDYDHNTTSNYPFWGLSVRLVRNAQ